MLAMQDLLDYCDLDEGEIKAIAEHEHIPLVVAAEMGECLLSSPEGVCKLHTMIAENMERAMQCGKFQHVKELETTYQHLQRTHPLPASMHV